MFFKVIVLKISEISQETTCVRVIFNKISGPQYCNFILKKRLQHRRSPVKFPNFLRTPFFTEHLHWLILSISGFRPKTLLKRDFGKDFLTEHPPHNCFLCLTVNFENFFRTPLLKSTSGKLLISCTSCRISTSRYSKKLFYRYFSSILYKNEK